MPKHRKPLLFLTPQKKLYPWEQNLSAKSPFGNRVYVSDLVNAYLHAPAFAVLKKRTRDNYHSILCVYENFILYTNDTIFKMSAHKVTHETVDYLARVMAFKYAPGTIANYFNVMSAIWEYGVRKQQVYLNPWLKPNLKRSPERDITWTKEQVATAINKAKELGYNVLALYILLAYETAQRPWRDLRDLKWDNVKTDENGNYIFDFSISKTNTHLLLPVNGTVKSMLDSVERISEYIFVDARGQRLSSMAVSLQFNAVKKTAGLPKDLLIRDLRRTAITELVEGGCNALEIEAITGWRCPESVIRRYARVRLKTAQNALEKRDNGRSQSNSGICEGA